MEKNHQIAALLLLGLVAVAGCTGGGGGTGSTSSTGTGADAASTAATAYLVMSITDAPAALNIQKAEVTISKVRVHIAGSPDEDPNVTTEAGWSAVSEEAKTFDLVAIKGVKEMLGSAKLAPGKYTQVRLDVDSAKVTIDGTEHDLTIPSRTIKLVKPFTLVNGTETKLTLDFDAAESIKEAGKDKYTMRPTIKVVEG